LVGIAACLRSEGAEVTAHQYMIKVLPLGNDLAGETTRTLWEAKADVGRKIIRTAIGQLLDRRRFEEVDWIFGFLLPRPPSETCWR
jgi:hypothetical protein